MVFLWLTMLCVQSSIKIAIYILNAEILFGMYEKGMFFKVFLMYEDTLLKFLEYITHHILVDNTRYLLDKLTDGLHVTGKLAALRKQSEPFADIFVQKKINTWCRDGGPHVWSSFIRKRFKCSSAPGESCKIVDYLQDCAGVLHVLVFLCIWLTCIWYYIYE